MPALSEVEPIDIAGVGTLEAFNTDGLRSLLRMQVPDMVEKTMRYPGHAERMRMLRETGFFSDEPITIGNQHVRPLDVTARLLFDAWQYQQNERDLTAMRVIVEGAERGAHVRYVYDLLDRYDDATGISSMARTTGYTCTAAVRLLAAGRYADTGITPPERLGSDATRFDFIFDDLARHGVRYHCTRTLLD
jgi:saccharopine dehydrogenase-like NADP-dependent oxidoreductase